MLPFLFSRTGATLAGVVVAMVFAVWAVIAAYQAGVKSERHATLTRSVENLRERSRIDDQMRNSDSGSLCRAIGGEWMPDDGTCQ